MFSDVGAARRERCLAQRRKGEGWPSGKPAAQRRMVYRVKKCFEPPINHSRQPFELGQEV